MNACSLPPDQSLASQFAWACCDAGLFPPPRPRKGLRYGTHAACWLCGGPTHDMGWPRKLGLADTFCDHNKAARLDSDTVCQACVATSSSNGWLQYCLAHPERGFWTHFPDKGNGKPRQFNWLYASHLIPLPVDYAAAQGIAGDRMRWGIRPPVRIAANCCDCVMPVPPS